MTDAPTPGEAAWLPDPSGRHEYRWYDGTSYTDRVADDGAVGVDAGADAPPPIPPPMPTWTTPGPVPAEPAAPVAPSRSRRRLVLGLAGLGVVLVAAGGYVVVSSSDDGGGTGTFEGRIEDGSPVGLHTVTLEAGDLLTVEVAPDGNLDAVIGFLVDDATAEVLEETYDGVVALDRRDLSDVFDVSSDDLGTPADQVLLRTDLGFPGEDELLLLAAPVAMEVGVVVGPFEPDADRGTYEITLERFALDVGDDADGAELLDAVGDVDEVPDDFATLADDLRLEH